MAAVHPGEVLWHAFMEPKGLSSNALAKRLDVPGNRVSAIVKGRRAVTGDTALRRAAAFGSEQDQARVWGTLAPATAEVWRDLQIGYELAVARYGFEDVIERVG